MVLKFFICILIFINIQSSFTQNSNANNEIPSLNKCGLQIHHRQRRVVGGTNAEINEFPWLVLLEFTKSNGEKKIQCAGTLISSRYVLTGATCTQPRGYTLTSVRVGEHNTETQPDCIGTSCTTSIDIPIESIIAHEDYKAETIPKNDIALLRLSKPVAFNNETFIDPICLPKTSPKTINLDGKDLFIAGWGRTESGKVSNIKLKASLAIVAKSDCKTTYAKIKAGDYIEDTHICAGGSSGQDACFGDSGAPLMVLDSDHWYVVGIVSTGRQPCGSPSWPGIYTNVEKYSDWINNNIKP